MNQGWGGGRGCIYNWQNLLYIRDVRATRMDSLRNRFSLMKFYEAGKIKFHESGRLDQIPNLASSYWNQTKVSIDLVKMQTKLQIEIQMKIQEIHKHFTNITQSYT